MRTLLNLIWLVFAGFGLAMAYIVAGVVCCLLIVTIPFGIASFRLASYVIWPFGRNVVPDPAAGGFSAVGNMIWFIVAGLWLVIGHIVTALMLAITIIGIPMAYANIKMIPLALAPMGKVIVPKDQLVVV